MLLKTGWFEWLPWRRGEAAPEPFTVLGLDPLVALLVLVGVAATAFVIVRHPRTFGRAIASAMGEMVGAIFGMAVVAAAIAGTAIAFFDVSAVAALVILGIVAVILLFAFLNA